MRFIPGLEQAGGWKGDGAELKDAEFRLISSPNENIPFIQVEASSFLRGDFHLLSFISEHHFQTGGKAQPGIIFGFQTGFCAPQDCFLGLVRLLECAFFGFEGDEVMRSIPKSS